jgi:hypothetical protein
VPGQPGTEADYRLSRLAASDLAGMEMVIFAIEPRSIRNDHIRSSGDNGKLGGRSYAPAPSASPLRATRRGYMGFRRSYVSRKRPKPWS